MARLVGTCMDMCPERELRDHENEPFEMDPRTRKLRRDLAVKRFERSAAGKEYRPEEIRPLPALQKSMDHLVNYVIAERTGTSEDTTEMNMYHYVRERVRTIKTDITVQNLVSQGVVEILERAVLFYVWAAARFADEPDFEAKQNMEQLTDNLTTVMQQFDELPAEERTLECEFRALNLLVFIADPQFNGRLMKYPADVVRSGPIQLVLELRRCLIERDIPGYLAAAAKLPIQFEFFAVWSLRSEPWRAEFNAMRACLKGNFPKSVVLDKLEIPQARLAAFCGVFGMRESGSETFCFVRNGEAADATLPEHVIPDRISATLKRIPCQDFMDLASIGAIQAPRPPPVIVSIPVAEPAPAPVLKVAPAASETESETSSESSSESEEQESSEREEQESSESEERGQEVTKIIPAPPPPRKTLNTRPLNVPQLRITAPGVRMVRPSVSIRAMVPNAIPPLCFSNIAVVASDHSESAEFAKERLADGVFGQSGVFQETIKVKDSELFINISTVVSASTTAVMHCNDTAAPAYGSIHCVEFRCAGNSARPFFCFNDALRQTIEASIVEFIPMDLAEHVLRRTLGKLFDRISTDYWYNASGNATLAAVNHVLDGIANAIESDKFLDCLPPLEHKLVSLADLYEFADVIRKVQLGRLDEQVSKRPQPATWPIYVRENLMLEIPPFIAPVRVTFDPDDFSDDIIAIYEHELESPSDVVHGCEPVTRQSFDQLLDDFDSVLSKM